MHLKVPPKLLLLNPNWNEKELRAVIRVILKSKSMKLRTAQIVDFTVPYLGRFKSHGNKKLKRDKLYREKDRIKKRKKYYRLKNDKIRCGL